MPIEYMVVSELLRETMDANPEVKEQLWIEALKAQATYRRLVAKIPIPGVRAMMFQEWTDKLIEVEIKRGMGKKVQCKVKCPYCCSLPVSATRDEASLLSVHLKKYPVKDNGECRFLKDSLCEVYKIRPASCRKHFSLEPGENCKLIMTRKIHKFVVVHAEILWSGAINVVGPVLLKNL